MKKNYIAAGLEKTVREMYPDKADELITALVKRIEVIRQENSDATKDKKFHLENQIMPGIAAYETLSRVMPKEKVLDIIHGYIEDNAHRLHKTFVRIVKIPLIYKAVPWMFTEGTRKMFGESAGFQANEIQTSGGVWRVDMLKCPYHDIYARYNCPELCHCICDSDDITYEGLHKNFVWRRTKTLGRGNECCDFCLKTKK